MKKSLFIAVCVTASMSALPVLAAEVYQSPAPVPAAPAISQSSSATESTSVSYASSAAPTMGSSASSAAPSMGTGASSAAPVMSDSSASTGTPVPPPAPTPTPAPKSDVSVGSIGSSGSRVGLFVVGSTCPLLKIAVLERGWPNDISEVTKLQSFLKNTQELDVDVTGVYDLKTENAVKAFQTTYASTILTPWGLTQPSGKVFITTAKKINELACKQPLSLTASELAILNAAQRETPVVASVPAEAPVATVDVATSSTDSDVTLGTAESNTGAVENANASIISRFFDFLVSLFR